MGANLEIVILAAGQGTRLKSAIPKVLHQIGGKPLLGHVIEAASSLTAPHNITVVYGHGGETVREALQASGVQWAKQEQQLGTGHAVAQALPHLKGEGGGTVLVLFGDVPLVQTPALQSLVAAAANALAVLTIDLDDPHGYGRIVRNSQGQVSRIVEQKDADEAEKAIREVNTGVMAMPYDLLKWWLPQLGNNNAQGEYYLTDLVALAAKESVPIKAEKAADPNDVLGVNNREQLAQLERIYQARQAQRLMAAGVTLRDPARFDLRGRILAMGTDVEIDPNVILEGDIRIGLGVKIGPNCFIRNADIGDGASIEANSVIDDAVIGAGCRIGPFARIRPQTVLADHVHVGNFVELKKSQVDRGSKINHLSYVGDATVGAGVNIGAGTITCNYDGVNKFQTVIEDGAFIGSDTQLVAPVRVGKNATIGAGSTITRDAPEEVLTLSRAKQLTVDGWKRPVKKN
ncbi:bifunctional UDP-N-acetylglucosamine diphosphorylase/glucosamine-1-phosphate N-acetyltransferase GlmU [Methylogaea oryzae]|uniref:Bifunctional protein GlmU n=1 Tax=Methylogaea oryzae TaxID=1295382 RepID=A0A8D5ALI3_9GAMM|nr:bifunctional UDP-N-acetylglucosamine diphosphorylase/glucosamine-1-phosphate N-acetyltransferase GlmU [Methylogaea oryzae]BBL72869.1 bifunctional protein GlmU [Methylogaea oryzae]